MEYKDLTFEELEKILTDDELNVKDEELVFEAIKIWIEVDVEGRKRHVSKLLNCIRFGLMSYKYFHDNILSWDLIRDDKVKNLRIE